jgi:hypothetical protein
LLRAAEASARDAGLRVLSGTAIESGRGIPYLPLISPLTTALDPRVTDDATRVVRDAPRVAGAETGVGSTGRRSFQGRSADRSDVRSPRRTPTLLAIDDVHWADSRRSPCWTTSRIGRPPPLAVICGPKRRARHGGLLPSPTAAVRSSSRSAA